ncbi:FAD-binding oxidoreductase [Achromobacter deleyi]|uniref:FAD-binding oxidoreductase n=1 Tax=Achromobacter deleyi TaxID=1353891 RepID=UPI001492211D|nr:FAD-binding oxidoreductase [Achromobacter deleyi]QVQ28417.1 FAD-binding oxidoreductase [Achromobacter deleyi]UIP18520.1 FAD-binding oxidoreductase [Achromobacter deleyi]
MTAGVAESLLAALRARLGQEWVWTGADAEPFLTDQRRLLHGRALAVVRPADAEEVAAVLRLCRAAGVPVVPQGGNTGLMGGATPDASGQAVLLSLGRLNRVLAVDTDNDTITVQAGCVLANVQEAASQANRLFPLSLGSEGSCTLGGNLSTNAGGTQVLRYGNARDLTLGLEVVTAEGEIWNGLRGLRKDNTGYSLRDLYIGSEGTLGVITAATLKLYPLPAGQDSAFVAFASIESALAFLSLARQRLGAALTAFELIGQAVLALVARHVPEQPQPLPALAQPWYALLETSGDDSGAALLQLAQDALEAGVVADAAVAQSLQQASAFWRLRDEAIGVAQARDGGNVKHDISVPISRVPMFLQNTAQALQALQPGLRPMAFGHLGDGNLHYNVSHDPGQPVARLFELEERIHDLVHAQAHAQGGSISAEHGIGQFKRDALPRFKSPLELALMRRIKQALDPLNLMNPGKVL